jgi:hypothetical protein
MRYAFFVYFLSLTTVCAFAFDTVKSDTQYYNVAYQQINLEPSVRKRSFFRRAPRFHSNYKYSSSHTIDLWSCSASQLLQYFSYYGYTEEEILSLNKLYVSDEFVKLAKTYPRYEAVITASYTHFSKKGWRGFLRKAAGFLKSQYRPGLQKHIKKLYQEIQNRKQIPCTYSCQKQLIAALESHNNKNSLVYAINQITQSVLDIASRNNYSVHMDVENALDTSIDMLKATDNQDVFLFHTAFVDYVLCDIEDQVSEHTDQQATLLQRVPALITRGVTTFFKALNPKTQIKNTCEFVVSTAHFAVDVMLGKLYLSEKKYQQRIDDFWSTCAALSPSNLAKLEAEQWVDIVAQLAADCVFLGGVSKTVMYLKEIGAVSKAQQNVARVAQKLKNAVDISLAEQPLVVTAEGIIFRATNEMKKFGCTTKEIISDSRKLLESARTGLLANLEKEMEYLRKIFDGKVKGFAECANKYIKPNYEHIFGMEFTFGRKGLTKVCGFHHDIVNLVEKSGIIEFANKIVYENGLYKATLRHNGNIVKQTATFFPSHWSREQVMNKIYEAYVNFIRSGSKPNLAKDGKYIIKGTIEEGIEIEMYITKNGHVVTAYPILE